jgi:sodium/proline symporter
VLKLVSYAWAGFGAAFGPTLLVSLLWAKTSRPAALAGILVGGGVVVGWNALQSQAQAGGGPAWLSAGIFELYALVPGFVLSLVTVVSITALSGAKQTGKSNQA